MRDPNGLLGLSIGFYQLDEETCDLKKGNVIVIAASLGIGKTSLLLNIIENLLLNEDMLVALLSFEVGDMQLTERLICSLS